MIKATWVDLIIARWVDMVMARWVKMVIARWVDRLSLGGQYGYRWVS